MSTLTVAKGSTKFALLCEWAKRQGTAFDTALGAGVDSADYARRTRELVSSGLLERTGKMDGSRPVLRITQAGRAACRALKAR